MATFNGQLKVNEVIGALFNMIISQWVYADNIEGLDTSLVDAARVDGGMYGDTKLYIATDVLKSIAWGADDEAGNLLQTHRPESPKTQAITLDIFRQIALTIDNYMSKRAFGDEYTFNMFNGTILGWVADTKKVYDNTTYNTFIGTHTATGAAQNINITLPVVANDNEATNRLQAQTIAQKVADVLVDVKDVSRDYNDNGFMRAFKPEDMVLVWNAEVYNKITKLDTPTIFHKDGLFENMKTYVLPAKYFGTINATSGESAELNSAIRVLSEGDYGEDHLFAGELLGNEEDYDAATTYTVDPSIACKIMHKDSVPYMSAFEVGTSFFNPKSLTENHYLTFGRNELEHLANYPFITITAAPAEETPETPEEPETPAETPAE